MYNYLIILYNAKIYYEAIYIMNTDLSPEVKEKLFIIVYSILQGDDKFEWFRNDCYVTNAEQKSHTNDSDVPYAINGSLFIAYVVAFL